MELATNSDALPSPSILFIGEFDHEHFAATNRYYKTNRQVSRLRIDQIQSGTQQLAGASLLVLFTSRPATIAQSDVDHIRQITPDTPILFLLGPWHAGKKYKPFECDNAKFLKAEHIGTIRREIEKAVLQSESPADPSDVSAKTNLATAQKSPPAYITTNYTENSPEIEFSERTQTAEFQTSQAGTDEGLEVESAIESELDSDDSDVDFEIENRLNQKLAQHARSIAEGAKNLNEPSTEQPTNSESLWPDNESIAGLSLDSITIGIAASSWDTFDCLSHVIKELGGKTVWVGTRSNENDAAQIFDVGIFAEHEQRDHFFQNLEWFCQSARSAPVLCLLGFLRKSDILNAKKAGAAAVLPKPMEITELVDVIHSLLVIR